MNALAHGRAGLVVVGLSRNTAPLRVLERASLDRPAARRLLRVLRAQAAVEGAIALSTCKRTEVYAVVRAEPGVEAARAIRAALARHTTVSAHELLRLGYSRAERAAAEHFLAMISGLDSTVLGEPEIVAQVRAAVALAEEEGALDRILTGLWNHGLAAGRRVRAGTSIARGAVSISAIAVEEAQSLVEDLSGRQALVIGAGRVGRNVAQRLMSRGARRIVVANRSAPAAVAIARAVGGRAVGLDSLGQELALADLVVCATVAPSYVVSERMLAAATRHRANPLVVLDLAVPRDVEPAAHDLPGVLLSDIDEIQRIAATNLDDRRRELPRAWSIVRDEAKRFYVWRAGLEAEPLLTELRRRAEEIRRLEIDRAIERSPTLDEEELARLDMITRSLMKRLLHEPANRIRRVGATRAGRAQLDVLRDLLGLANSEARAQASARERLSGVVASDFESLEIGNGDLAAGTPAA